MLIGHKAYEIKCLESGCNGVKTERCHHMIRIATRLIFHHVIHRRVSYDYMVRMYDMMIIVFFQQIHIKTSFCPHLRVYLVDVLIHFYVVIMFQVYSSCEWSLRKGVVKW